MVELRRSTRYVVKLPCQLGSDSFSLSGLICDISAFGARIELPITHNQLNMWSLDWVTVGPLGRVEVELRWMSGNILGVMFLSKPSQIDLFVETLSDQAAGTFGLTSGHSVVLRRSVQTRSPESSGPLG